MRHRHAILFVLLCACAGRDAVLSRTSLGLEAGHQSLVDLDKPTQDAIIAAAKTEADGQAALAAYRKRRDAAHLAFVAAQAAVAGCALDMSDANFTRMATLAAAAIAALRGVQL